MSLLKYPIKYFGGPKIWMHTSRYIGQSLEVVSADFPIVGETGIDGLLIDFNCGLRLQIPEGNWHVQIVDGASGLIFFDEDASAVTLISAEKFYVEWEIAVWLDGEPVFYHQFDPHGQQVHFNVMGALGDNIALLPWVEEFRQVFDCKVTVTIAEMFHGIIKNYFPHFRLSGKAKKLPPPEPPPADSYAQYYISAWQARPTQSTTDMRILPMELLGRTILDTPKIPRPKKIIYTPTEPRSIDQKYVCIAVQASNNPKCWLNPGGWDRVVDYLKTLGYRVLCIDRDRRCTNYDMTVEMPEGAENFSGDYNLIDRINQLAYADFFIGLSSGLAWLAWAVDIPVVIVSGITEPWFEFESAYRVNNPLVCHGCFNHRPKDSHMILDCVDRKDVPRERMYECSKKISARMVIDAIDQLIADHNLLEGRREC